MKCCSNKPRWSRLLSIVTLTPFLFLGCSGGRDGPERFELNGKVTVDGVPVLSGMLAISPDTKKGNSGPGTTIIIGQGAYEVDSDKGVVGGPHIIQITVYEVGQLTEKGQADDDEAESGTVYQKTLEVDLPEKGGTYDFKL